MEASLPTRMAVVVGKSWSPGATLSVRFLDGQPEIHGRVESIAQQWTDYLNLGLVFDPTAEAVIRISFEQPGSWSYIGTDARGIAIDRPTMNFGWLQPGLSDSEYQRVVLHEFGHALGAVHEHQNPAVEIPWDKEAVYRHYAGPPNFWDRETVDVNLFETYAAERTNHTSFDPESIMLYPIPNELTIEDFEVDWNESISTLDGQLMRSQYPADPPDPKRLEIGGDAVEDAIGRHGEVDDFWFEVTEGGSYQIETTGETDVVMGLFGPGDSDLRIAEDDDSGRDRNALIRIMLGPGIYTVRVWHYWPRGVGEYRVSVRAS